MDLIKTIEEQQKKPNAEYFSVGDTVKAVSYTHLTLPTTCQV